MTESSLYERLGGALAIAAVVDHFSDAIVHNPIVGQNSENLALREWHTNNLGRLPGLKFMRTLWVCNVAGGPQQYAATKPGSTPLGLEEAHRELKISPAEFDEVAAELARTLDSFKGSRAGERRSSGGVRRTQGRGDRRIEVAAAGGLMTAVAAGMSEARRRRISSPEPLPKRRGPRSFCDESA
jgi:hemoglobin